MCRLNPNPRTLPFRTNKQEMVCNTDNYDMTDKMKNLLVRTVSGVALAVVIFGAVLWSPWSLGILLALLIVGGMVEFYALARRCGAAPQSVIGIVAGLAVLVAVCFPSGKLFGCALLALFLLVPLSFFCELWSKSEHPIANIATTIMGVFYVAVPFSLLYFFVYSCGAWVSADGAAGRWALLGYIVIIWANDVCAYLVGWAFGRHPLFPRLSPKKSWEGFIGGIVGAVCVGVFVGHLLDSSCMVWAGLALVASVTGVAGDLVESMFKRAAGVKDSGSVIPGHGGVLDRFDAMLLSIPFVLVYLLFIVL